MTQEGQTGRAHSAYVKMFSQHPVKKAGKVAGEADFNKYF